MAKLTDEAGRTMQVALVREFTHRLVGGDLAADGSQYSTEVPTVLADTDYEAFTLTLDNGQVGDIEELEFGLTHSQKAGSATADVKYKWQARNKGGSTWVDLHTAVDVANINTTYISYTMSGYRIAGVANLNTYPIDIRLLIQSNEAAPGVSTARVKNSSYVTVKVK
jgi:hypothetical protein